MPNTIVDIDALSRNRIVQETDKNFFVEAGAGSGKTTMLVNRMVAMVEQGKEIDKICAITFTKAAAGEFYERFQKILIERSSDNYVWVDKGYPGQLPRPTDETKERCRKALQNIDLCFMGTIDAFCGMILSEHPSEAGIPSDATIMTDADVKALYKREYVKISEGEYGTELADYAKSFRILFWNSEEVFVKGMKLIMNHRNFHFNYTQTLAENVDNKFRTERTELIRALNCLTQNPELKYTGEKKSDKAWEVLPDSLKVIKSKWSINFTRVLRAINDIANLRVIKTGLDTNGTELSSSFVLGGAKGGWLEFNANKQGGILQKISDYQYSLSMTFLMKCIPVIENTMRDKGAFTYFDYLYYLRNMLKDDAGKGGKLVKYIFDRHSYFLIDEFQDTNPMQAEVFFYLTAENPVANWEACIPRQGSLFIVGDPKQSIYRFRSADVTSFLNVKRLFTAAGGEILTLSRNFRSTRTLCESFNKSFKEMLPVETATQSKFEEIPLPDPKTDEFQGVFKYTAYTASLEATHPDMTDPMQIGKIICSMVNNPNVKIRTEGDTEPRTLRFSDFMVITYGKSKLPAIMARLDELGIPTRVEGKVPFESNEALIEVLKIYKAAADISDSLSLYGALTSKLIGHSKGDILKYKSQGGSLKFYKALNREEVNDEGALAVDDSIGMLRELSNKAGRLSPAALLSEIIDTFEIYKTVSADNMEVVYYTLELIRNAEKSRIVNSLKDGAEYIQTLVDGGAEEERCLSLSENKDCVHMANLHKVKGLEAPVVILAAALQFRAVATERFTHDTAVSEGYVFSLNERLESGGNYAYFKTWEHADQMELEKVALQDENLRLVYVAGTRARNALIICDSIKATAQGETHKSVWSPLMRNGATDIFNALGQTRTSINQTAANVDPEELYRNAADDSVLNDRIVEESTFEIKKPSAARASSKLAEKTGVAVAMDIDPDDNNIKPAAEESTEEKETKQDETKQEGANNTFSSVHKIPKEFGTMTHKLLEMLVSTRNIINVDDAVDEIIREYTSPRIMPYEKDIKDALVSIATTLRNGGYKQNNDVPDDILTELITADEVYCEIPFCYKEDTDEGAIIWNGIMDAVYCKNGKWHIVDYKTNLDGDNLDIRYQGQLEAYIRAFKEITGQDADAKTYHVVV